jgi:hypothetical protein
MPDRFRVDVKTGMFRDPWPQYFDNFFHHCLRIANENGWEGITVMNYELKPLGGKLIQTKTQGWYLRWDTESAHTLFVLRWS